MIEQALEDAPPLDPTIVEQLQDAHAASVQLQIANGEFAAKRDDEVKEAIIQEQAETTLDDDGFAVNPTIEPVTTTKKLDGSDGQPIDEPKPKMRRRYLNRNGVWLRAQKIVKRRPGEAVFVRNGPADFEKIGIVGAGGVLPVAYVKGEN